VLENSIAFQSLSTDKYTESFDFYRNKLGLRVEEVRDGFLHVQLPGGNVMVVYHKTDHSPSGSTVLNFQVDDIEHVVGKLSEKGVVFLQYDVPFETDKKGISWDENGSHIAWFKDPGGNIMAIIEN
jgi:catechol 2,3-dioxygenase-like lactoylglutathione lyase family enzyme